MGSRLGRSGSYYRGVRARRARSAQERERRRRASETGDTRHVAPRIQWVFRMRMYRERADARGAGAWGCGSGSPTGRMRDRGGYRGWGSRTRFGGEAERERASQVSDGTCAREGVLFTRTSDGRCTNIPGGRVEACGVRTGVGACRPFGSGYGLRRSRGSAFAPSLMLIFASYVSYALPSLRGTTVT